MVTKMILLLSSMLSSGLGQISGMVTTICTVGIVALYAMSASDVK